ncbi:MAG: DUF333 domain-containing protein [Candidatus Micrarchaeota archaeon]|nr:DUF333 domain-containing protein [Candidatus Micrarchaeota archaeon]
MRMVLSLIALLALLFGCALQQQAPVQQTQQPAPQQQEEMPPAPPSEPEKKQQQAEVPNPASVNCAKKGGRLEIRDEPGGQVGYCIFPNGKECEEWALFRGQCSPEAAKPLAKEGEFCGGIAAIACEAGLDCVLDGSYPDAGGVCRGSIDAGKKDEFYICPSKRNEMCTAEYKPVCGRLVGADPEVAGYRDYPNPCVACSKKSNAVGYYLGTCAGRGKA